MPGGCCTYPHGAWSVYGLILSISAYLLAISSSWGCYYVKINSTLNPVPPNYYSTAYPSGIGLFSYETETYNTDNWVCAEYTQDMINALWDGSYTAAFAFGIMGNFCIGISMLCLMIASCIQFSSIALRAITFLLFAGSFCVWMTYLMFNSSLCAQFQCEFWIGAGLAIGAAILAAMTGCIVTQYPAAQPPDISTDMPGGQQGQAQAFAPGTQTVTETVLPDGTKKITKTTVNPDGSQTVEETVIQPNE